VVAGTTNKPELLETVPIVDERKKGGRVVLSFGPQTATETPFPDLEPGDDFGSSPSSR
jgi:hypothetical protein